MGIRPGIRDLGWMAAGASALLLVMLPVLQYRTDRSPAAQFASRAKQLALVGRMSLGLASASEAEKRAVMALSDDDSQAYAEQARVATAAVDQAGKELEEMLAASGNRNEMEALREFSRCLGELQRIDHELLDLAVKNTNLKASRLTFGPAAAQLEDLDAALLRVRNASAVAGDLQSSRLADDARVAALRIQALLPPHIAEESDQVMAEMEARIAREDRVVHDSLTELAAMPALRGNLDLQTAVSAYARLSETRSWVLALSRENTNVRSLAISLDRKRKAALVCEDALVAVKNAIEHAPIATPPVNPR